MGLQTGNCSKLRELQDNQEDPHDDESFAISCGLGGSPQYSSKLSRLITIVSCSDPRFAAVVQELYIKRDVQ
jgi:hypothetical protein